MPTADTSNPPVVENFREKAQKDFKEIVEILNQNGIEFFLLSGTMLGAVRESDFIEHDWDIDLGVIGKPNDQTQINIVGALEAIGHKWMAEWGKNSGRIHTEKRVITDIHFFEIINEQLQCWCLDKLILTIPEQFFKPDTANLHTGVYAILDKKYLDWMYGDWKKPKKTNYFKNGYDYTQDPSWGI